MIYLDTSVAMAQLLSEARVPPATLWAQPLCASRLFQYELVVRLQSERVDTEIIEAAEALCGQLTLIEMRPDVLARATEPFPKPVRTLDAIHLATLDFLAKQGMKVKLATYDKRMADVAAAMRIELVDC